MPRLHDFDAPHFAELERHIIHLWVGGHEWTYQRVADLVAPPQDGKLVTGNGTARDRLKAMAAAGFIVERDTGMRKRPYAFNRSAAALENATLDSALAVFLASDEVSKRSKDDVVAALRYVLRPRGCRTSPHRDGKAPEIIALCGKVGAERVQTLLSLVAAFCREDLAAGRGVSQKSVRNHVAALRALLRFIANRRLMPLVFSASMGEGPWGEIKGRHLSARDAQGRYTLTARYLRTAWETFRNAAVEAYPDRELDPASLTVGDVDGVIQFLNRSGRRGAVTRVRQMWRELNAQGVGPIIGVLSDERVTPASRVCLPSGTAPTNWIEFAAALAHCGFPSELVEQVTWYGQFTTLSIRQLRDRRADFPRRLAKRLLSDGSVRLHIQGLRTWIGFVLNRHAIDPADATPELLFGQRAPAFGEEIGDWWEARAATGEVSAAWTTGLKGILVSSAMIALGCYERSKHQRKAIVAVRTSVGAGRGEGRDHLDRRAEEAAEKTPLEAQYYETYTELGVVNETRAADVSRRSTRKGGPRSAPNGRIDVLTLMRTIPPAWWAAVLQQMHRRVRQGIDANERSFSFHRLVTDTLWLGMLISTGCRGKELAHMRLDIQAVDLLTNRRIELRAVDRKNGREQTAIVRLETVPDDILSFYLTTTRRLLMSKEKGAASQHAWLFVNSKGMPLGCIEESNDGKGRDDKRFDSRINGYRTRWQNAVACFAAQAGCEIPLGWGELGFHTVRRVHGFQIYLQDGLEAAANYLGDHPDSVMDRYATVSGEFLPERQELRTYDQELLALLTAKNSGDLTEAEFSRAKLSIGERYAAMAA